MNFLGDYLKKTGAILDGHFLLSSGLHSPNYVQCALALKDPVLAGKLGRELFRAWQGPRPDLIVSPAMGGIIIGHEVARNFRVPFVFTERENDFMTFRRGFGVERRQKVIIVEDVFTTGKSTMEVASLLKEKGAVILGAMSVINRLGDKKLKLKNISLLKLDLETYKPEKCPLCARKIPFIKPGSRKQ